VTLKKGGLNTYSRNFKCGICITDQITDQDVPCCDELRFNICSKTRELHQMRCLKRARNHPDRTKPY